MDRIERYELIDVVGEGSFGRLYKAKDTLADRFVAIKELKETSDDFVPEVRPLTVLEHPNIVNLKLVLHEEDVDYLVFEFMERSLGDVIDDRRRRGVRFSEAEIRSISFQVLEGLEFMHDRYEYMHRDLKPDNILVNNGVVNISDLGFAIELDCEGPLNTYVGTTWYRAPEMLVGSCEYDEKVDMWSMGLIMAELFHMQPLFMDYDPHRQLNKICKVIRGVGLKALLPYASKEAIDLVKSLCSLSPLKRLSAEEALRHSFFKRGQNVEAPPGFSYCTRTMKNVVLRPSLLIALLDTYELDLFSILFAKFRPK